MLYARKHRHHIGAGKFRAWSLVICGDVVLLLPLFEFANLPTMSMRERVSEQVKPFAVAGAAVVFVVIAEPCFANLYSCLKLSKVCSN